MEWSFNPFDLRESLNYEWLAHTINNKCKVYFIYDYEDKSETIRMFICEMQENEIIATYEITDISKQEMFNIYSEIFNAPFWQVKIEVETQIYAMLPFEEKYFDNE